MGTWGQVSLSERRPGVFKIRIAVGVDPSPAGRSNGHSGSTEHSRMPRSAGVNSPPSLPSTGRSVVPHRSCRSASCWNGGWSPTTIGGGRPGPAPDPTSRRSPRMSSPADGCRHCDPRSSAKPWPGGRRRVQRVRRVGSVSGAPFVRRMGTVRIDHRPQSDQGHAGSDLFMVGAGAVVLSCCLLLAMCLSHSSLAGRAAALTGTGRQA
jgi:hypothetical protein